MTNPSSVYLPSILKQCSSRTLFQPKNRPPNPRGEAEMGKTPFSTSEQAAAKVPSATMRNEVLPCSEQFGNRNNPQWQ